MKTTVVYALPYPDETDSADVPRDVSALAHKLDTVLPGIANLTISTKSASYVLALTDSNSVVEMNLAGANTVTVPPSSAVAFPIGTAITVAQMGPGQTTLVAGAGVLLRAYNGNLKLAGQSGVAALIKRAADEWWAAGNLVLVSLPIGVLCVDRVKPTVAVTSPANGSKIAGTITLAVNAADNDQVATVQFQIDGANLGGPVPAPFQVAYDTHLLTAAGHTFGAVATDRLGNVSALAQSVANVVNAPPAAGQTLLGDMIAWDGSGYSNYRTQSEPYDGSGGDWWWSQTGDKTTPVYFPGNPDPTHYQMRAWFTGSRLEGGDSGNVVTIDCIIAGTWYTPWQNGPTYPGIPGLGPIVNINGGEPFCAKRWASNPPMNTGFCQGVAGGYDFVLKPGYQS